MLPVYSIRDGWKTISNNTAIFEKCIELLHVRVFGNVEPEMVKAMVDGVELEDGIARFTDVQYAGGEGINNWFHVVLTEGRNRAVRRLWESQGLEVSRLKRVRYGNQFLGSDLRTGQWKDLDLPETKALYRAVGLKPPRKIYKPAPKERQEIARQQGKRAKPTSASRANAWRRASSSAESKDSKPARRE